MAKRKKAEIEDTIGFEIASENIFEDIGIANPDEELTKAKLVSEIDHVIKKKRLTQVKAAEVMGISQPKVSALLKRKLAGFSVERIMHLLNQLGQDIEIIVKPKPRNRRNAHVHVVGTNSHSSRISVPLAAKSS